MNTRETKTINAIEIFASSTASNRDTYANLYVTVSSMMVDLVLANKNLVEALTGKTLLEQVLGQCQQRTRSGGGSAGR